MEFMQKMIHPEAKYSQYHFEVKVTLQYWMYTLEMVAFQMRYIRCCASNYRIKTALSTCSQLFKIQKIVIRLDSVSLFIAQLQID